MASRIRVEAHVHIGRRRRGETRDLSVRNLPNGRVSHEDYLLIREATFAVQPAGHRRFRETGQKNVHAFVRGELNSEKNSGWPWREISYNPAKNVSFVDKETGIPVYGSQFAMYDNGRLYYLNL